MVKSGGREGEKVAPWMPKPKMKSGNQPWYMCCSPENACFLTPKILESFTRRCQPVSWHGSLLNLIVYHQPIKNKWAGNHVRYQLIFGGHLQNQLPQCFQQCNQTMGIFFHITIIRLFFFLWAALHGMWDLSSQTRDWTQAPCRGSRALTTNHWPTREFPDFHFIVKAWMSICLGKRNMEGFCARGKKPMALDSDIETCFVFSLQEWEKLQQ